MTKRSSGFTLIELMVVIALLAFLGAMAGRSMFDVNSWLANYRLKAAARELSLNLQKARMKAIQENRVWKVVFNTDNNTYKLQYNAGTSATPNWTDSDGSEVNLAVQYPSGVKYGLGSATAGVDGSEGEVTFNTTETYPEVVFSYTGAANQTGYCHLYNKQNASCAVGVMATGNVIVKKWNAQANAWQ
jgi:prepilin-type N-terminal cleavage/methylation domain-containing protein